MKTAGVEFHGGVEFEQALVDAAQFLAAQVAVVHQPPAAAVFDEPEIAYRQEQVLVGEFGGFEFGHGLRAKEEAAKGRESQLRAAPVIPQPGKNQAQAYPEIGVSAATSALRHPAQTLAAVETGIARPGLIGCAREVEQIPVLGHEEEDQPVDQPEQLAVEVLFL